MSSYEELLVWQKAHELALEVYKATNKFPKSEIYSLTNQVRRASSSVAANIVEGHSRHSSKDKCRFMEIARGSLAETEYFIQLATDLGYIKENPDKIKSLISQTGALLWRYQSKFKQQ